ASSQWSRDEPRTRSTTPETLSFLEAFMRTRLLTLVVILFWTEATFAGMHMVQTLDISNGSQKITIQKLQDDVDPTIYALAVKQIQQVGSNLSVTTAYGPIWQIELRSTTAQVLIPSVPNPYVAEACGAEPLPEKNIILVRTTPTGNVTL